MPSVIYAIEEPETSQHTAHQKMLIKALIELSESNNTQILLTTHSPVIVKEMTFDHLRLILLKASTSVRANILFITLKTKVTSSKGKCSVTPFLVIQKSLNCSMCMV